MDELEQEVYVLFDTLKDYEGDEAMFRKILGGAPAQVIIREGRRRQTIRSAAAGLRLTDAIVDELTARYGKDKVAVREIPVAQQWKHGSRFEKNKS